MAVTFMSTLFLALLFAAAGFAFAQPGFQKAISEFKQGKVEYRADKTGIGHLPFGGADFPEEDLLVNLLAAIKSVEANKPSGAKGVYWKSAHICSAMGVGQQDKKS